jgi:hypothetical protein
MKDWHALWLHWTVPGSTDGTGPYGENPKPPSLVETWASAGQQWWTWWVAAAASPWMRQPWPHPGQLEAPEPGHGAGMQHPLPPHPRDLPAVHSHAPDSRKAPNKRLEHKSRQLQRRKINPGG